jgi:predicted nuclease of predicted toxin-antitoxin system
LRILFDQGVPVPLRRLLGSHAVETAHERGWSLMRNGELIASSENDGFDVFVTTDQNLKYQQNLEQRKVGVVVLLSTSWPRIQKWRDSIIKAIESVSGGGYTEVDIK